MKSTKPSASTGSSRTGAGTRSSTGGKGSIGPNAVAWDKSNAPLRKAKGSTVNGANQTLTDDLTELKRKLPRITQVAHRRVNGHRA